MRLPSAVLALAVCNACASHATPPEATPPEGIYPDETTHPLPADLSGSVAFRVESLLPEPDVGGTLPGWKLSSHKHWV